ncbi:MAG: hypothetical protein L0241_28040 [Planctomycetia bacterium]|nr:hypothetical protein [Planctomycetia bacterium]
MTLAFRFAKFTLLIVSALVGVLFASPARAAEASPFAPQSMDALVRMSACELEALYRLSPPASVPCGFVPGRAIKKPGSRLTVLNSRATGLVWKGKIFRDGTMINKLAGGLKVIPADVYLGESWLDGGPSLILDYSRSTLWPDVRDELREVSPGLYLGIMYRTRSGTPKQVMFFTLDARK